MADQQLWAPWRLDYVQGQEQSSEPEDRPLKLLAGGDPDCFICRAVADSADRRRYVVERGEHHIVILNRYPYNNGHLMIAPPQHRGRLDELTAEQQLASLQAINRMVGVLEKALKPHGFNIGLNLGRVAGAGTPGHLHWHVVPRWSGDTNFMPVLASVDIIPQSLDALWELLVNELANHEG